MRFLISLAASAVVFSASHAQTQDASLPMGGWGMNSVYNRLYDPNAVITFSGKVIGVVDSESPAQGMTPVSSLLVRNKNGGTATVDLGPSWFLTHQQTKLKLNDRVQVTGSKVFLNNRSFIVARKVVKGSRVLYLRELTGFPMWIAVRGSSTVAMNRPSTVTTTNPSRRDIVGPVVNQNARSAVNPDTGQSLNGTVQQVLTVPNGQTGEPSSVLVVNTPQGLMNIDLGPQWYIQQQNMPLLPGNVVFLNGVRPIQIPGSPTPIYVTNDVGFNNQVMVLRTGGYPVWNPWTKGR
jgi:hypothetical protein